MDPSSVIKLSRYVVETEPSSFEERFFPRGIINRTNMFLLAKTTYIDESRLYNGFHSPYEHNDIDLESIHIKRIIIRGYMEQCATMI